jgi:hypothetical protein
MKLRRGIVTIADPRLDLVSCSGDYAGISSRLQFIPPEKSDAWEQLGVAVHHGIRLALFESRGTS